MSRPTSIPSEDSIDSRMSPPIGAMREFSRVNAPINEPTLTKPRQSFRELLKTFWILTLATGFRQSCSAGSRSLDP